MLARDERCWTFVGFVMLPPACSPGSEATSELVLFLQGRLSLIGFPTFVSWSDIWGGVAFDEDSSFALLVEGCCWVEVVGKGATGL